MGLLNWQNRSGMTQGKKHVYSFSEHFLENITFCQRQDFEVLSILRSKIY